MSTEDLTLYSIDMDGSMEPDENGRWARADDARELQTQLSYERALNTNMKVSIEAAFKAYEQGKMEHVRAILLGTLMEVR